MFKNSFGKSCLTEALDRLPITPRSSSASNPLTSSDSECIQQQTKDENVYLESTNDEEIESLPMEVSKLIIEHSSAAALEEEHQNEDFLI